MAVDKQRISDPETIKAVIFEDQQYAREGIMANLRSAGIEADGTGDPDMILGLIESMQPNIAIIDLKKRRTLTDQEIVGIELVKTIKHTFPHVKCIVLTAFPSIPNYIAAIKAGCEGFISKETTIESNISLAQIVKMVFCGERYYDPEVSAELARHIDESHFQQNNDEDFEYTKNLTERERQIVLELAKGRSNKEISNELHISENTVKVHLRNIYQKVNLTRRDLAAVIARTMHRK